jgi:hypothetical protein
VGVAIKPPTLRSAQDGIGLDLVEPPDLLLERGRARSPFTMIPLAPQKELLAAAGA